MAFVDYETCEPLRVWNRLEPRSREVEFDRALSAEVHDPLWMLARQWMVGEFKGEDAGSAVLAKLARRVTPVGHTRVGAEDVPEDLSLPAEARFERLAVDFPPLMRAQIGRTFLLTLADAAAGRAFQTGHYRDLFRAAFPIAPPAAPADGVERARARASARARRVSAALAGRAVDGRALFEALTPGMTVAQLPPAVAAGLIPGDEDVVLTALETFRVAHASLYPAPPVGVGAWDGEQLEYRGAHRVPRTGGTVELTLDEHVTGRLDWWAYDQGAISAASTPATTVDVRTVIPAPAEFAGMPNPRWWQFEDAAVDLGNFRAQATDLAKIVVAEFALLYGNNWLVVPYRQPVGSLAEIEGIVVTDVFGHRTLATAAVPSSGGRWTEWDLFSLSPRGSAGGSAPLPQHLFLPAAAAQVQDAAAHESVSLVRDESANMVWGVERRVPDGLGGAQDGTETARRFTDALNGEPERAEGLRYRLGTQVPESWIPFLPVHVPGSTRDIRLRRGVMQRRLPDGSEQPVRPRTTILRSGISDDDVSATAYYLNEEEVPRVGVHVNGALRRARWLNGATVVWHGRTVSSGRGEVDSGLRFDVVERP